MNKMANPFEGFDSDDDDDDGGFDPFFMGGMGGHFKAKKK